MMSTDIRKWSLAAVALAVAGAAPMPAPQGPATQPGKPATSADLGGADRFLAFISTDKPIYRPSEKVYVRAVLLNAATHQPLADNAQAQGQVTILGPKGETVASGMAPSQESVVGFAWAVPETASGGEYTFKINFPFQGYAPAERKFDVRVYRAPRLRNQITFVRDGYGPGDKVTATVHSERAEGGFPAGARVTVTARVDDVQVFTGPATVDAKGDCTANFTLPKAMERGEGTLAFAIEDGGVVETASKTIPILLQTLDLAIYPEGGDAVAGVDNRFYIEAKTPAKKPADLAGAIFDSRGKQVATVKTEHEGRGRFDFTPVKGETYTLRLSEPAGITKTWKVPDAKNSGVVIHSTQDIIPKGQSIRLTVAGNTDDFKEPTKLRVTVSRRETIVAESTLAGTFSPRQPGVVYPTLVSNIGGNIELKLPPEADGVLTVTVWNDKGEPLAERLTYRQPEHQVQVQVTPSQSTYVPGQKASLDIFTTDETGKAVAANVGLTVTDDTVLEMVEKREQAPRLPVMVFLEPEVRELADAHVYLDPNNPKAALATDLLLGTQGWRRFALINANDFLSKYGDSGKRVLAFSKPEPQMLQKGMAFGGGGMRGGRGGMLLVNLGANGPAGDIREAADAEFMLRDGLEGALPQAAAKKEAAEGEDKDLGLFAATQPAGGGGGGRRMRQMAPVVNNMLVVREYAHELRPNWSPLDRSDFAETVYWNAGIKTDEHGHATAAFNLADSVTTFRIFGDAFSKNGAVGSSSNTIQAVQPFFIEPKLPLEVTAGDVIDLPIAAVNNSDHALKDYAVKLALPAGLTQIDATSVAKSEELAAGARARKSFTLVLGDKIGEMDVTINATAGEFADKVTRKLRVKPKGFPTQLAYGGLIDSSSPAHKEFKVPTSLVPNSMSSFVTVYPSPVANLTDAVAALMREPNGCFEQTSSTNYPLAMAQLYFGTHQGVDPKLIAQSDELLRKGYQRLVGFECRDKGYEWFGGEAPGHEALTAYGLMEFHDMEQARLAIVDDKMIQRTRTWLIGREDGKGGFQRNARALDSFGGAPELTTNAYIVWALLQAGESAQTLEKEIAAVRDAAKTSDDSYILALAANICELTKDHEAAQAFMTKLAKKQNKSGAVDGAVTSITRSGGDALAIETTALAALAWQQEKDFAGNAQQSIQFLADSCKGGRFGSTQSTILALKAIVAYDQSQAHPKAPGKLVLMVDERPVGEPVEFTADTKGAITFPDFASMLTPGPHSVEVRMAGGSQMPYSFGVTYNSVTPSSDKQCKLELQTWLKDAQLAEGNITEARVEVTNKTDKDAATPVAIIGIPGGLEVRHDQLKELVKAGKIDAYEVNGREVVLYWRQIKTGAKVDLSLSLAAAVPGKYTAPASRVYEYYTDEFKQWAEGTSVTITPK